MSGIGPIKLPIVSTFDPSGVAQAKAGLKDLQTAQGQAASSSSRPAGAASGVSAGGGFWQRMGIGQAGHTLAGSMGFGGVSSAMSITAPVAMTAAAGTAIYALTQKVASEAIALRDTARQIGVTTNEYGQLEVAARKAGIGVGTVTQGLAKMRSIMGGATSGNVGAAMMIRSMGISLRDAESSLDSPLAMAQRLAGSNLTAAQKAAMFGSVAAADALASSKQTSWTQPTAAEGRAAAGLGSGLMNFGVRTVGGLAMAPGYFGSLASHLMNGQFITPSQHYAAEDRTAVSQDRMGKEAQMRGERLTAAYQEAESLVSARERHAMETAARANLFSDMGPMAARMKGLDAARLTERLNQALAPVRSDRENLNATIASSSERWGLMRTDADRRDVARGLGSSLTDQVESIMRSGSLAGASDINSVAGYSQLVESEYAMSKNSDTARMVELLIQMNEKLGTMSAEQAKAVRDELGFRNRDPIFGGN